MRHGMLPLTTKTEGAEDLTLPSNLEEILSSSQTNPVVSKGKQE